MNYEHNKRLIYRDICDDYGIIHSEITAFIIECSVDVLKSGKSLIVECPSSYNEISSVIAYWYSKETEKTAIIFSSSEKIDDINKNYHHLFDAKDNRCQLIFRVPIAIKTNDGIVVKPVVLKGAKRSVKTKLADLYSEYIHDVRKPVIILSPDDEKNKEISDLIIENRNPSIAIFNNIDCSNYSKLNKIIEWCETNKLSFLFLTDYIPPRNYEILSNNAELLTIKNGMFDTLPECRIALSKQFESQNYKKYGHILDLYNIDRKFHYDRVAEIQHIQIDNGSYLVRLQAEISSLIKRINHVSFSVKHDLIQLSKIAYSAVNSFTPIDHILRYSELICRNVNGFDICKTLSNHLKNKKDLHSEALIDHFLTLWCVLDQCRSPLFNSGYTKDNKFSKLINIIKENYDKYGHIFIVSDESREFATLIRLINSIIPDSINDKIIICSPHLLNEEWCYDSLMILPGIISLNELYIYKYPFSKIIVLSYCGKNYEMSFDTTELFLNLDDYYKKVFAKSIRTMIEHVPTIEQNIECSHIIKKMYSSISTQISDLSVEKTQDLSKIVKKCPELNNYIKNLEALKNVEKENNTQINETKWKKSDHYLVDLEDIDTGNVIRKRFEKNAFVPIVICDSISEVNIGKCEVGTIIINLSKNHHDLLDLLLELYGYKEKINYSVVEIWEDCLKSVGDFDLLYSSYYNYGGQKQKQTVRTWFNRSCMGPDSPQDLKIIGESLNDDELSNNADYVFKELERIRHIKQLLGRRLSKIVSLIVKKGPISNEPYVIDIYEYIKDCIFKITDIKYVEINNNKLTDTLAL